MKYNAKAGLLTYSRVSGLPIPTSRNSGRLIGNPLRSLQLRDSYRFTLYSLLIPGVKPETKSAAKVAKLNNM
ncbi:hypothetical protein ASU31_25015 [Pedobacter ginsenosidimutans]|uniref:Uncharacterized protein n=1 Tax=Pedobacter ginsenosidimutans TaxID=687842 RepID=A0A0T5VHR4_9SPHI|nr:hypothetical protein ASU31_25015 [Pedobacter ginsenosidimutans]